jgi:hypothetical protein
MHADVDERAERGDVGDHAFQHHARLEVLDVLDALGEAAALNSGRGSRPGFSSSLRMSRTVGTPKRSSVNCSGLSERTKPPSPIRP